MAIVVTHSAFSEQQPLSFKEFFDANLKTQKDALLDEHPTYAPGRLTTYFKTRRRFQDLQVKNFVELFSYRTAPYEFVMRSLREVSVGDIEKEMNVEARKRGLNSAQLGRFSDQIDRRSKILTFCGIGSVVNVIDSPPEKEVPIIQYHMEKIIEAGMPDYYMKISEAWIANHNDAQLTKQLQERWGPNCENQKQGDVAKLPSSDRVETLTFIARTLNNSCPKMSKVYEIIRERRNDESSKVLELKDLDLDLGTESMIHPRRSYTSNNTWADGDGR